KSPSDLVVDAASENEVIFRFDILEGAKLANPLGTVNLMITFNPEPMRFNSELTQGD
ncbi:hypothetical protein KI387_015676, partial [Taxus chinensis]